MSMLLVFVPKEESFKLFGGSILYCGRGLYMLNTVIKYVHTENLKSGFQSIINIRGISFYQLAT